MYKHRKARTAARFPGPIANRLTPPKTTLCAGCPGAESIPDPVMPSIMPGTPEWERATIIGGFHAQVLDVEKRRDEIEARRTFSSRRAWKRHAMQAGHVDAGTVA